jgi:hypothetical protein
MRHHRLDNGRKGKAEHEWPKDFPEYAEGHKECF